MDRSQLNDLLKQLLGSGSVYFQPPANVKMEYPCFVYQRAKMDTRFANNNPYRLTERYTITYIDRIPDSPVVKAVASLPGCTHSAFFVRDSLNHDVFDIFI